MQDPLSNSAFRAVIEEYEARAAREQELFEKLNSTEAMQRRDEMLLTVGRAAAVFLDMLIREGALKRILEVGSSYGYSTHWLADGARAVGGRVISLELQAPKTEYARARLQRTGLADFVEFRIGDALESLASLPGPFDLVLIDLWKDLYVPVFERLHPKLAPGAIVVADNMLYPPAVRADAEAYRARVRAAAGMSSVLLTIGNGLEVSRYR
jgi:predicted O-methyltransferase YrrM